MNVGELVRDTRRHLLGPGRDLKNSLAELRYAGQPTITLTYPVAGVQVGSTIEVGWSEYTVMDVTPASRTLAILPEDPDAPDEFLTGTVVTIKSRFPSARVLAALNVELDHLSGGSGLYRVDAVEVLAGLVAMPPGVLRVLDAIPLPGYYLPDRLSPADFSFIETPEGRVVVGDKLALTSLLIFGSAFDHLPADPLADVVAETGLPETGPDLPSYGAAMRLASGLEAERNDIASQGDTRRPDEVPSGSWTGVVRTLTAIRAERVQAETTRLQERYGFRRVLV